MSAPLFNRHTDACVTARCTDPAHGTAFDPMPEGCRCNPATWFLVVDPICRQFSRHDGSLLLPCFTCHHDYECHEGGR